MKQNGEPTVEEILASIKQVIARDSGFEPRRREPVAPAFDEDDVLDLADAAEIEAADEAPLVTEDARASMRESLAALAAISGPGAVPQIVRSGETSLEGMVRELLRPALAQWLDQNLPALVEKLVATEIARIVGKKG
jgi:cell pole-organizing protein PopZ